MSLGAFLAELSLSQVSGTEGPVERGERIVAVRSVLAARTQLARIGTNLNQIARVANASGEIHDRQLGVVLSRVNESIDQADQAVGRLIKLIKW